jgi:hypothetical protein
MMKVKATLGAFAFAVVFYTLLFGSFSQQPAKSPRFPHFIWVFWEGELNVFT